MISTLLIPILYLTHSSHTSPLVTISLFSLVRSLFLGFSLSPFFLCSFVLFLQFHIGVKSYGVCLSLTGLFCLALYSTSIHVLQMARFRSFWWLKNIPLCVYMLHLLYPLSMDGHSGCFCNLAIVNYAVINIGCIYPFKYSLKIFFNYYFLICIYLTHREREKAHAGGAAGRGRERSRLPTEQGAWWRLSPRTLGSWPELKADT